MADAQHYQVRIVCNLASRSTLPITRNYYVDSGFVRRFETVSSEFNRPRKDRINNPYCPRSAKPTNERKETAVNTFILPFRSIRIYRSSIERDFFAKRIIRHFLS